MIVTSPIGSTSSLLWWSNVVYVAGAALTLAAAVTVFIEKKLFTAGKKERRLFITEFIAAGAAAVSLIGTAGAIHYGNTVNSLKDADLAAYKQAAQVEIAGSQKEAAVANQKAQEARAKAESAAQENVKLQLELSRHEGNEKKTDVELASQAKSNSDFAHALAQQQATMAEQVHSSPVLSSPQISTLASLLRPFSGSDVILHSTGDTTVLRLKQSVAHALLLAGITFKQNEIDYGALFQGVSVAVHSPNDVPPLATALVRGLRGAGIEVHAVAAPRQVPSGRVAIYMGPN